MEKTVLSFYIWGAGIRGKRLLKIVDDTNREWEPMLHDKLYDVIGFIDKRKDFGIRNKYLAVSDEAHISGNEQVINVFSRNKDAILIASEKYSNELNQNAVELGFWHVINMERYM